MEIRILKKEIEKIKCWLEFLAANRDSLFLAFVWVLFMVFFTYTTLVVELVRTEGDFCELFYQEQSRYIALFVNVGIVIMLLFDNHVANQRFQGYSYYVPIVALVFCLIIMAHCEANIHDNIQEYVKPISLEYLSIVAYGCFLFLVYMSLLVLFQLAISFMLV